MRSFIKSFALCAFFAATAVSCAKHELEAPLTAEPAPDKPLIRQQYVFDIAEDPATSATLDNNGVLWEPGDMVGIYLDAAGLGNDEAEIDTETSPKKVILRSANAIPEGTVAYAYYPFDENTSSPSAVTFHIPNHQSGGSISSMPMAGVPFTITAGGGTSTNGQVYFINLASIIDFKVYSSLYAGEIVQSITFQSWGQAIAGDAVMDLTAIDPDDEQTLAFSSWGSRQYDYVTVRQNATVTAAKDDAASIHMVLAPGTYPSGTITIVTNEATYTFQMSNKALERNELKHYTMNLNNATRQVLSEISTFPYTEAFTENKGDFVIEGGTGSEWVFDTNYGAKASGRYKGAGENASQNHNVSTALVSPWINLSGLQGVTLSFSHAINSFLDVSAGAAGVYIMAQGDEDWTQLGVTFPERPGNGYSSYTPVEMDLSAYVGHKIRIKFAYMSTTESCGVWEIKDFKVDSYIPTQVYAQYSGDLSEGDYVIYYNGKALKNTITSNRFDYAEISPSGSEIEDPDASIIWHIAPSGNYWTIYNASVQKYAASTGVNNKGQLLDSGADDKSLWSVSGSSTYDFTNKYNSENEVNATLRNNGSYGFACYNPNNTGGALTLYKLGFNTSSGSGSGGSGGGTTPATDLPGHLGCFEIPGVSGVSFSGSGDEVLPTTNPTQWLRFDTGNAKQKIVTHTFKNTVVSPNRVMRSYTLLQDYDKKCALWVACAMNNDVYPQAVSRKEKWTWDPALDHDWQPNLTDSYPDQGGYSYDRGHQLAASYRETTTDQVKMTCYFTNMTPQLSGLNQGRWQSTVEANVRSLGAATTGRDTLYVVSGPLFQGNYGTVKDKDGTPCARPSHYFQCFMKVRYNNSGTPVSAKGAAYLVEHVSSPTVQYVTIDYVESQTDDGQGNHFDFFANVPADIQNTAEATATALGSF